MADEAVIKAGSEGAPPADATGNKGANGAAPPPANPPNKNKPCACSKKTSKKNRKEVNKKDANGQAAKCAICGRTGQQVKTDFQNQYMQAFETATSPKAAAEAAKKLAFWRSPNAPTKLQADHIFPASQIKQAPGFQALEGRDVGAARRIMTAQFNMRGLCASCNASKNDKQVHYDVKRVKNIYDEVALDNQQRIQGMISRLLH